MEAVICGALGALLVLGLLTLGFFMGWRGRQARENGPEQGDGEGCTEQERMELREQQRAFEGMLNYNADVAYGLTGGLTGLLDGKGAEG